MDFKTVKLYDSHLHFKDDDEIKEFLNSNIIGVYSVNRDSEYEKFIEYQNENLIFSAGVHPWFIENHNLDKMQCILEKASIIGEIGLDNIWCDTDIDKQKQVFINQLKYASENNKPVILHTKGMEEKVLSCIRKFDNKYLVHWYSCEKFIEEYINIDCYFTIGPSVLWDKSVINLAKKIPLDRLLIETDGISAVKWAYEAINYTNKITYRETLVNTLKSVSEIRNMTIEKICEAVEVNFKRFFINE